MKLPVVFFLILYCFLLHSQDQKVKIPDSFGSYFTYRVSEDRLIHKLQQFEAYSDVDLDSISAWRYHIALSSCKLYLGRDSSLYHFKEAFKISPRLTCTTPRSKHNVFMDYVSKGTEDAYMRQIKKETGDSTFSWYLWDIPDFDEFAFIDSCNILYPLKKKKTISRDNMMYSELIRKRDQEHRGKNDLKNQHASDQKNRDLIDSLYEARGSLDSFNEEEIYQFSMVLHHSEDCEWVYTWSKRLIDFNMSGYKGKMLLGPMLKRMLGSNGGFCTEIDIARRDSFIGRLLKKYPDFLERYKLEW